MKKILLMAMLLVPTTVSAKTWKEFCDGMQTWKKGQLVPEASEYKGVGSIIDAKAAKASSEKTDVIFIDARKKADRATGKIPKTLALSASKNKAKNKFHKDTFLKKAAKYTKKYKGGEKASMEELTKMKYITFCNGKKCHRSTAAACILRSWGVPAENISIMTGGFPEWKEAGFPTR